MSSVLKGAKPQRQSLRSLEIVVTSDFDPLSRDLEYPGCPNCEMNDGRFTQLCENSDRLRCVRCDEKFGDINEVATTRDLPRPVRDDFVACVVAGANPEDQAKYRGVPPEEVRMNLDRAGELLSRDWGGQWQEKQRSGQ